MLSVRSDIDRHLKWCSLRFVDGDTNLHKGVSSDVSRSRRRLQHLTWPAVPARQTAPQSHQGKMAGCLPCCLRALARNLHSGDWDKRNLIIFADKIGIQPSLMVELGERERWETRKRGGMKGERNRECNVSQWNHPTSPASAHPGWSMTSSSSSHTVRVHGSCSSTDTPLPPAADSTSGRNRSC